MAQKNKTAPTAVDPHDFIGRVDDERKRKDSEELITIMQKVTRQPPRMWGANIVGFGVNKYKYESGREGEICLTGFSPRKPGLVLYLGEVLQDADQMARLGKHKTGKGCLYIKTLDDVDPKVLKELVTRAVAMTRKRMKTN
jgi:hypothetical protein